MEITTRQADVYDAVDILRLLVAMHSESPIALPAIHGAKALSAINQAIAEGHVEVALQDGYIVGAIGGLAFSEWYSIENRMGDLFYYVAPECRASQAAVLLIKEFTNAADIRGLGVKVGTVTGEDLEKKDKFFNRLGFRRAGSHYILEVW